MYVFVFFLPYNLRAFFSDLLIPQILGPDVLSSLKRSFPGFETYVSVLDKNGRAAPQGMFRTDFSTFAAEM